MRGAFQEATAKGLSEDDRLFLLLGDIGVFGFRHLAESFPDRVRNMGILEQAMVSFAAGLASSGKIPILHSIAPFLVERALEQIKVDFGYQSLPGKFVSVGSSFDYSKLGATHHSPGDVSVFGSIPGAEIWVPVSELDVADTLSRELHSSKLSYFRLSEHPSKTVGAVGPSGIIQIREGKLATIVAVGPTIDSVMVATAGLDVQLLSASKVSPFPISELNELSTSRRLIFVEPYYEGTTASFTHTLSSNFECRFIGVPREFIHDYGTFQDLESIVGLDVASIRNKIMIALGLK